MYNYVYVNFNNDYYKTSIKIESELHPGIYCNTLPLYRLNKMSRILYRVHMASKTNRLFELPFKKIWVKEIIDPYLDEKISKEDNNRFIFSGFAYEYISMGLCEELRKRYNNAKLICFFGDKIDLYKKHNPRFEINKIKELFDLVITYNEIDAKKYDILLERPKAINYSEVLENEKETIETDVFFVGRNKGRLKKLISLYDFFEDKGLKCNFYITNVPKSEIVERKGITYNQHISYEEVLRKSNSSKGILNVVQDGAAGITFRDYEAIGMDKYLITNNYSLQQYPFYTEEKVIWIDNISNEINKLKKQEISSWKSVDEYSVSEWYKWLESNL